MLRAAAAVALLLLATPAFAESSTSAPETDCDRLSGMPLDQDWLDLDKPGPVYSKGQTKEEVDAIAAACRSALDQHPDEKRFAFRLGLALKDAGRTDEALAAFETARRLGSVGGYDEAAVILIYGSPTEPAWGKQDRPAGEALLEEGVVRTGAQMLKNSRAVARLGRKDEAVRGEADLLKLGEEGSTYALAMLADRWLADAPDKREAALGLLRKAVDLGSGYAPAKLGDELRGTDDVEMIRLYRLGIERGSPDAMNALGYCYEHGIGVPQVESIARDNYEMAALRGQLSAQGNLGGSYGNGEVRDYDKARRWLEIATERGSKRAPMPLGMLYDWGRGVPADQAKARAYYEIGAARGDDGAMNNMGYLFEHGRAAEIDLAKAREWYEKAAEAGSSDATNSLSLIYRDGRGVPKDYDKAFKLSMKSAEAKNAQGVNNLALAYQRGQGVAKDLVTARALLAEAEELGSNEAAHNLAGMMEAGQGGEVDNEGAQKYFRKAARGGLPNAMYRYGNRVRLDANKDDKEAWRAAMIEARNWLKRAVDAGDPYGVAVLAEMSADGVGGPADPDEALRLYRKAAETDDEAKIEFANRLRTGKGVPADPRAARDMAAEARSAPVAAVYVEMLDRGEGGPKDPKGGTEFLRKRVEGGDAYLAGLLAERMLIGLGAKRDPQAARALLTALVDKPLGADGALKLGRMRELGQGGPKDFEGAVAAYRKGADGSKEAAWRLALALRAGRGAPTNLAEARKLLESVDPDSGPAAAALVEMQDRGEGGPANPEDAALRLLYAIVVTGDPAAIDLAARPDGKLAAATRAAFVKTAASQGLAPPKKAGDSGPLLGAETMRLLKKRGRADDQSSLK